MQESSTFAAVLGFVLMLGATEALAQVAVQRITVVDFDEPSRGVPSAIYVRDRESNEREMDTTNEGGRLDLSPSLTCAAGQRFQARPGALAPGYFNSRWLTCTDTVTLRVQVRSRIASLENGASEAAARGDHATALAIYSDIAARLRGVDEERTQQAETAALTAAGRVFRVARPTVFDRAQQRTVMSPELSAAVRQFQASQGLRPTGELNNRTILRAPRVPRQPM